MTDEEIQAAIKLHADFQLANAHMPFWTPDQIPPGYTPPIGPPVFVTRPIGTQLRKPIELPELEA